MRAKLGQHAAVGLVVLHQQRLGELDLQPARVRCRSRAACPRSSEARYACRNWRADRLTAMRSGGRPMRSQSASCAQAVRMTQAPTGRIRPVSSSTAMKRSGGTSPRPGAVPAQQRLHAGDGAGRAGRPWAGSAAGTRSRSMARRSAPSSDRRAVDRGIQVVAEEAVGAAAQRLGCGTSPCRCGAPARRGRRRRSGTSRCRCWPRSRPLPRRARNGAVEGVEQAAARSAPRPRRRRCLRR